jgi:hypothetical protein
MLYIQHIHEYFGSYMILLLFSIISASDSEFVSDSDSDFFSEFVSDCDCEFVSEFDSFSEFVSDIISKFITICVLKSITDCISVYKSKLLLDFIMSNDKHLNYFYINFFILIFASFANSLTIGLLL